MKYSLIGRRGVLGVAGAFMLPAATARAQGAGVALVIGNSKYQWEAQLPNVRRDAPDIAKRFQAMGFKTELLQDLGRDAMKAAIEKWGAASQGAGTAAFYFAGHGANWGRQTFLVPADVDLSNPSVAESLTPTNAVGTAASGAASRLVILDACRNNPADGWRQVQAQRGAVVNENRTGGDSLPKTLVMFSTAPGRVARRELAAERTGELPGDGQPESRAVRPAARNAEEALAETMQECFGHAGAVVLDAQSRATRFQGFHHHRHRMPLACVEDRIVDQVVENVPQCRGVAFDQHVTTGAGIADVDPGSQAVGYPARDGLHGQGGQIHRHAGGTGFRRGLRARQREQLVGTT